MTEAEVADYLATTGLPELPDLTFDYSVTDEYGLTTPATVEITIPAAAPLAAPAGSELTGTADADVLIGGSGDDVIIGDGGDDTLTGGLGSDTFVFNFASDTGLGLDGADTVTDFSAGDVLRFDDVVGTTDIAALDAMVTVVDDGTDTTISFDAGGGSVVLSGVAGVPDGTGDAYNTLQEMIDDGGYSIQVA